MRIFSFIVMMMYLYPHYLQLVYLEANISLALQRQQPNLVSAKYLHVIEMLD